MQQNLPLGLKLFSLSFLFLFYSCEQPDPVIFGCVDSAAINFNPQATEDDGSCISDGVAPTWEDNFNGSTLDNTKWTHQIGDGSQYGLWQWGNGELQYYKPENTTLNDGIATITVKEEQQGDYNYTSSRFISDDKFTFKYGRVEARIKTVDGQGLWPAFWLLPSGGEWPCDGEIDIMEQWASSNTNITTGAAHLGNCPYVQSEHQYLYFNHAQIGSYADDFHVYAIQWEPDLIKWYVDDEMVFEVRPEDYNSNYSWPFNSNEWYIVINLAVSSSGPNNQTLFPAEMQIDWVKVYTTD